MANVKNSSLDTSTIKDIDIQSLINEAVEKALNIVNESNQQKVKELEQQLQTKNHELREKETQEGNMVRAISPDKMVEIMHMGPGSASFNRGRVNVKFNKLFDQRRLKFDILDEMFYAFESWFHNFEIIILDQEVREYFGIEYNFKDHGADKDKFHKMLKIDNAEMLKELTNFSPVVTWAYLVFFLEEYVKGNADTMKDNKFNDIQQYYSSKYSITDIQGMTRDLMIKED